MRIPRGNPVHENLSTSYVNVGALLADLQVNGFTGYVQVGMQGCDAYVFIDSGAIIGAVERTDTAARTGAEAINGLLVRAEQPGGRVSIYDHSTTTIQAITGMIEARTVYQDLSSEFVDLDKLVGRLRRDRSLISYIEVVVTGEAGSGIIHIKGGETDGVYSPADGAMLTGPLALAKMVEIAAATETTLNVYAALAAARVAPVIGPADDALGTRSTAGGSEGLALIVPFAEDSAAGAYDYVAPLVGLMGDVVSAIERTATAHDSAGAFAIELRAGQLEVAEHFPFLDPFAAEFEYHAGEIAFVGQAEPEEFAVGLGEVLHRAIAALARRNGAEGERLRTRIAAAVAALYEARQEEFDAYGLAGLLGYIADPGAQSAGEAGISEPL